MYNAECRVPTAGPHNHLPIINQSGGGGDPNNATSPSHHQGEEMQVASGVHAHTTPRPIHYPALPKRQPASELMTSASISILPDRSRHGYFCYRCSCFVLIYPTCPGVRPPSRVRSGPVRPVRGPWPASAADRRRRRPRSPSPLMNL